MRKCFLLLMATVCLCVNAQEKGVENDSPLLKGNITIGGGLSIDYEKEDSYSSNSYYSGSDSETAMFLLNPQVGYFFVNRLELGVGVPIQFMRTLPRGEFDGLTHFMIGISPYIKYYCKNKIFVQLSAGGQIGNYKFDDDDNDLKVNSIEITPSVGYAFFINSKISIEPSISYRFNKITQKVRIDTYEYSGYGSSGGYGSYGYGDIEGDKFYTENSGIMFNVGFHLFL